MKKKLLSAILCISMAAGVLAGCGSGSSSSSTSSSASSSTSSTSTSSSSAASSSSGSSSIEYASDDERGIVEGTVVNIGQTSDKPNHLPWLNSAGGFLYMQIYDTLFYAVDGDWSNIDGLLAESWEFDDDNLGITIKLVENATFTSGNPVNAQAVVDCFAYTEEYMATYFTKIDSIEATGEYELYFKFNSAYPDFCTQFAAWYTGIVDPAAVEEYGAEDNAAAVGSGPYYIESYSPTDKLVLRANENYWNASRMPSVETVNLVYIPDTNTEQIALQNGEIDFMEVSDADTLALLATDDSIEYQEYPGTLIPFFYNLNSDVFADERVREALSLLVNWEDVAYMQSGEYGIACTNPWLDDNIANTEEGRDITSDPDTALALLEEAGVDPSEITFNAIGCSHAKPSLTSIQSQLAEYGITMTFDIYDYGVFNSQVAGGDWDLCTISGNMNSYAPLDGYKGYVGEDASRKVVDYSTNDPETEATINSILDEADACTTLEDQAEVLQGITQIISDDYAWMGSVVMCKFNVYSSRLSNVHFETYQGFFMLYDIIVEE